MGNTQQKTASTTGLKDKVSELCRAITPSDNFLIEHFTSIEFAAALRKIKLSKPPGPDHICPKLILHASPVIKS